MNLADVMDELGDALDGVTGLRVFRYPPESIVPPAAIVGYPDEIVYSGTYQRGMDAMTVPIVVVVGKVSDRSARDAIAAYCDGSGAKSVKTVIDGGTYTALDTATVTRADFDTFTINSIDYLAATFEVDVTGSGSEE